MDLVGAQVLRTLRIVPATQALQASHRTKFISDPAMLQKQIVGIVFSLVCTAAGVLLSLVCAAAVVGVALLLLCAVCLAFAAIGVMVCSPIAAAAVHACSAAHWWCWCTNRLVLCRCIA